MESMQNNSALFAGIQMQLWEVVLLATRYSALGSGTTYSWAADIRWPALLRDLGFSPDSSIPAGKTASLTDIADLLTMRPPDVRCLAFGMLSEGLSCIRAPEALPGCLTADCQF